METYDYIVRIRVDTWLQKILGFFGLVIGYEYSTEDKHFVAIFLGKWDDFVK